MTKDVEQDERWDRVSALLAKGELDAAREVCMAWLAECPNSLKAKVILARVFKAQQDLANSRSLLGQCIDTATLPWHLEVLAEEAYDAQGYALVERSIHKAVEFEQSNPSGHRITLGYVFLALAYLDSGDPRRAIEVAASWDEGAQGWYRDGLLTRDRMKQLCEEAISAAERGETDPTPWGAKS